MRVLLACEESQAVCKAFRVRGHEAYSCDILPCSGGCLGTLKARQRACGYTGSRSLCILITGARR